MSYFNDFNKYDPNTIIDGVNFPYTSKPIYAKPELVTDGGRLADSIEYEGSVKGLKKVMTLRYDVLNREHYKTVYDATMGKYEAGNKEMFFDITVPVAGGDGLKTFTVYLGASSFSNCDCVENTIPHYLETNDESYNYGGNNFDELFTDIEIVLIEK